MVRQSRSDKPKPNPLNQEHIAALVEQVYKLASEMKDVVEHTNLTAVFPLDFREKSATGRETRQADQRPGQGLGLLVIMWRGRRRSPRRCGEIISIVRPRICLGAMLGALAFRRFIELRKSRPLLLRLLGHLRSCIGFCQIEMDLRAGWAEPAGGLKFA